MKLLLCLLLASPMAFSKPAYILIENTVGNALSSQLKSSIKRKKLSEKFSAIKIEERFIEHLSHAVHEEFHKCGGFFHFETEAELNEFVTDFKRSRKNAPKDFFLFEDLSGKDPKFTPRTPQRKITKAMEEVNEISIRSTIEKLSSYKTRKYNSETGVTSAKWIAGNWQEITKGRDDASVSLFEHKSWAQPSVILKIEGDTKDAIWMN